MLICEVCLRSMEHIKQKYICKNCGHIKPCCEGDKVKTTN